MGITFYKSKMYSNVKTYSLSFSAEKEVNPFPTGK